MKKWITLCSIWFFLMLSDGLLTYINTPDLKREGNPLVAVFGLGWESLFLANILVFGLYIITTYYAFVRYKTVAIQAKNVFEYISGLLYGRTDKFIWFLYKFPKNRKPYGAILGFALAYTMIVGRTVVVLEWLCITLKVDMTSYNKIASFFPFGRVDVVLAMIVCISSILLWFKMQHEKSKKILQS